jgi:hypothetical protein
MVKSGFSHPEWEEAQPFTATGIIRIVKKWEIELEAANNARLAGNEGRARVCARRAAGKSAQAYLMRHQVRTDGANYYTALLTLARFSRLTPEMTIALSHLTLHVSEDFILPPGVDLIADARFICENLEEMP